MADYKLHVYPVDSSAQVIRKNANESDSGATAFTFVAADFIKIKNTGNMRLFIEIGATSTSVKVFTSLKVDGLYDVSRHKGKCGSSRVRLVCILTDNLCRRVHRLSLIHI